MSKGISNKIGRGRKPAARSGVRYGWRKRAKMAAKFENVRSFRTFQAALALHADTNGNDGAAV